MEPGATLEQQIPVEWNSFMYILEGKAVVGSNPDAAPIDAHNLILLDRQGDGVCVRTLDERCAFVLLSGEPTGESVKQYGTLHRD
jgi:redox-sensitive bicupin YhaK (pirin superfamily)